LRLIGGGRAVGEMSHAGVLRNGIGVLEIHQQKIDFKLTLA